MVVRVYAGPAMTLLGRRMFAVAFIAFGLLQFLYADFVAGRPPAWPEQLYGGWIWAYASGACFVAAGAAILADRFQRPAAFSIAVLVFAWAATRNLPVALADASFGSAWTRLGKAVALTGGALAVAASVRQADRGTMAAVVIAGRVGFAAFLIASGVQHFLFPDAVTTLVPAWIPVARFWAYFAGLALIAGGFGLIVPRTTRIAGFSVALMVFTWVCILHIPRALAASAAAQRNEWTAVFEALAFAGIALVLTERSASSSRS
jgi:uncharacterized membrane protein